MLSGYDLVTKGVTKNGSTLPEKGLKDAIPNGSWLEQKQIQAALEARKHVVEVERIAKNGTLSHAEWREDLFLAEATQRVGGYWHFMGHQKGAKIYLHPEEALYLIEVNCLLLKHNGVLVSLQKAYHLLLRDEKSLMKYRVYASLYRIGYKVFRHEPNRGKNTEKQMEKQNSEIDVEEINNSHVSETTKVNKEDNLKLKMEAEDEIAVDVKVEHLDEEMDIIIINNPTKESASSCESANTTDAIGASQKTNDKITTGAEQITETQENKEDIISVQNSNVSESNQSCKENGISAETLKQNISTNTETTFDDVETNSSDEGDSDNEESNHAKTKINKLKALQSKNGCARNTHCYYNDMPDFAENTIVTVQMPEKSLVPNKVASNNCSTTYVINLQNVRSKPRPASNDSSNYSPTEEVNGPHVKRVRNTSNNEYGTNTQSIITNPIITDPMITNPIITNPTFQQRSQTRPQFMNFWKTRNANPYYNTFFNNSYMMFHRQFQQNMYYQTFYNRVPYQRQFIWRNQGVSQQTYNWGSQNNRKRKRGKDAKNKHKTIIRNLAFRLKQLIVTGNYDAENIRALRRLIQTFNIKYKANIFLTNDMDVVEQQNIVDTITLDEDDETQRKRARTDESYNENLELLKQLAEKFKDLVARNIPASSLKRALSNAVKTFNNSYKAELYIDGDNNICDPSFVNLDSDSDDDCVIQENDPPKHKYKLLLNPLSVRKNRARTESPSTSNSNHMTQNQDYNENFKSVNKYWLPKEDDFGRAEVLPRNETNKRLLDAQKEQYIYEFIKHASSDFEDWLSLKIAFWETLVEVPRITNDVFIMDHDECDVKPIIKPRDRTDLESVLEKLSIIKNCQDTTAETSLAIDFDVYERDVKNFRKTDRPTPHFRIMCLSESSSLPSGDDIAALHSCFLFEDVPIILAIVSPASVSYLQANPVEIPVYMPGNDMSL